MALKYGDLSLSYDTASDILYVSLGDPRPALTFEERDGVLVRKDIESGKLIAVTVLDYETHFRNIPESDITWLRQTSLPSELVAFLEYRPSPSAIFEP